MTTKEHPAKELSLDSPTGPNRPLSALLSQTLVAYTIEFDNEFQLRLREAGYPGAGLSLFVWASLMRFLPEGGLPVRELAAKALTTDNQIKHELGCLERWRFLFLEPDAADKRPIPLALHRGAGRELRDGWGSGRGIRAEWIVRPTRKGQKAIDIWPTLFEVIGARWQTRFGSARMSRLRDSLVAVVEQLDVELPHALPYSFERNEVFPPRVTRDAARLSLPALLSQLLLQFTIEFDRESDVPLALCANTLRILGENPVRVAEIARSTGLSPEMSAVGWRLKPFVLVDADPDARRGKVARLTPRGLKAQHTYQRLNQEIEKRWEDRFGKEKICAVRECLRELFALRNANRPLLAAGLLPLEGVVRAGNQAPALGRREPAAAAKQRMRDLVKQNLEFVRDPAGALPYYPIWDMNRGFGP